jgi:hypothetical protein
MRLAHYPHHERAAEIADELGILLWEEIPVYWAIDFRQSRATYRDAENQLLELIRRDRNRASVVIWSIGNENPDTDDRLTFMRGLADAARACDPTRLVAAACLINHHKLKIEDRLAEHLDIIGINEYYGWYDEDFDELGRDRQEFLAEPAGRHFRDRRRWCHGRTRSERRSLLRGLYVRGLSPADRNTTRAGLREGHVALDPL